MMLPFPGLQQRYPSFKQGASDRDYVLLEQMSDADIAFNVARLRKEGATKSKHADVSASSGLSPARESRRRWDECRRS